MNEKSILSLLVGPGIFSNKELKEVASKAFNPKFLKEFDELNIKLPDDTRENERLADEDSDANSLISIEDEEQRRLKEKYEPLSSGPVSGKNPFQKTRAEEEDFENFEEEDDNRSYIPRQPMLIMPKIAIVKPNPYEKMTIRQILSVSGEERGQDIYRFTEMYLPTTKENRTNVFKYLYRHLIRNPKDILKIHRGRHERILTFEKEVLRYFRLMYDHRLAGKQDIAATKTPEASISIVKDTVKPPLAYSHDPVFSPVNSAEWFDSLQQDLMKGITTEMEVEVEKEPLEERKTTGVEHINSWAQHNGVPSGFGVNDKQIQVETSIKREKEKDIKTMNTPAGMKTEKYNFQKALSSLFESTPTREDNENSEGSEDQSEAHPFGGTPRNESDSNGIGMYNKTLNENMREYLNDNYDKDKKALFSFYTGLKGHDKNETALWGETRKETVDGYDMIGTTTIKGNINYNYVVLPFKNDKKRSIFKYQADMQDDTEMELALLHKKRRLGKDREMKLTVNPSENIYFNKNVLEATWNDFFFKSKPHSRKEKEYSLVLIDLNDRSIFYDRIHPFIFGVQKASRRTITAFDEVPDQANPPDLMEESKDLPDIDTAELPPTFGKISSTLGPSKDSLVVPGGDRTHHVPSESDSMVPDKKSRDNWRKQHGKELRIAAVIHGLDPDQLTIEQAKELLRQTGKSESKNLKNISLPPVLKLVNDLKRKTATSTVIQHSKVAEEFQFNEFHIKRQDYEYFHRPDLKKLVEKEKNSYPWRIEVVKQEEEKKDEEFSLDEPFGVKELVDSFEYFKNQKRLSLREGKFSLFEYIEENPLIISNVGMASRINRYVYPSRAYAKVKQQNQKEGGNESKELMDFIKMIKETLGSNGSINFLDEKQSLPLIGQLTDDRFIGVTILDNNMFYAPIFIHKAPETDFVLVRYHSSDGSKRCYLRKIEYIYTVGQIEPKVEVFNPSSRSLTSFIKKASKHIIKKRFANNEPVHMEEMKQLFPTVNDHNMKKYIQAYGGDPDPDDTKRFFYNKDLDHELIEDDADKNEGNITPEEVCQYERMHASNVRLKNLGLEDLRSCDKINTIRNRYIKRNNLKIWDETIEYNDKRNYTRMNIVANYVSEELQLTAWNLSQSFLSSKQKQGRLYLTGFGDPTAGHGGYSYVKLPLKTSRYEKEEKKNNAQKLSQVTGTNADLRKLPIKHVARLIIEYGDYKEEHIAKLSRWDKIDLLRKVANKHPENEELAKYARAFRLTTKMQREKYQEDINKLFMTLIENLSKQGTDHIPGDADVEFEYEVSQLIEKELEETIKKAPKDLANADKMEDDKGDDDDDEMPDENTNDFGF